MRASDLNRTAHAMAIRQAATVDEVAQARALFEEYAAQLNVDLCFQGFADELANLPGAYVPPRGCLLLAGPVDAPVACVALRPLAVAGIPDATVGEVKRLYVQPAARGQGLADALMQRLFAAARAAGYRELKLDTLASMTAARQLYARLGFRETSPYYRNPVPDTVYLGCTL